MKFSTTATIIGRIILILSFFTVLVWADFRFASSYPVGRDFLVNWAGFRSLLVEGKSPYSGNLQNYLSQSKEIGSVGEDTRFVFTSPIYTGFLIMPFALISNLVVAWIGWLVLTEISILIVVFVSLRVIDWKPGGLLLFWLLVFSLFSCSSFLAINLGSMAVFSGLLLLLALSAIRTGKDELAGIFLAFTTVQPFTALIPLLFVLFWTISFHRWKLVVWFVAGLAFLALIGVFFIPDWPLQYVRVLWVNWEFLPLSSPARAFAKWWPGIGRQLGWTLTGMMGILLLGEWFAARRKDFRWFLWTACLTLVISQWIGIPTDPSNLVILLVPLILVLGTLDQRMGAVGRWIGIASLLVLWVGIWAVLLRIVDTGGKGQDYMALIFPLPFFLLISLYWVRWWAIRPMKLYVEELKGSDLIR